MTEERNPEIKGHDPGLKRYWDSVRIELSKWWSPEWQYRRRLGIERRREEVRRRLEQPVVLPEWLDKLLQEHRAEFTPRQVEALVYRYGYELTHREAAEVLGLPSRHTFRKRLDGAVGKARNLVGRYDL